MNLILSILLTLLPLDTTTFHLEEVAVVEHKSGSQESLREQSLQATMLTFSDLKNTPVITPKQIAAEVPNLHMPDYGSAMTSTIYARGMGARLDQPVIGITIDGVPLLDKNTYDQTLTDLTRAVFFAGPQGTMYGRNTMGGLLALTTRHPLDLTAQDGYLSLDYGSANSLRVQGAWYRPVNDRFGLTLAAGYGRTDGFYTNQYTKSPVDAGQDATLRLLMQFHPNPQWNILHHTDCRYVEQGAFPYADAHTRVIAFNSPSSYRRLTLHESVTAHWTHDRHHLQLMGTYQLLMDHMLMDQDYTPASYFTLEQQQRQHAAMVDAVFQSRPAVCWYRYLVGAAVFVKHNRMDAPVTFLSDGIDSLILYNANAGIRKVFPNDSLAISESELPMTNRFTLLNAGGAIYHQSEFIPIEHLHLTLGLRLDIEHAAMDYYANAPLHYRLTAFMPSPAAFSTTLRGRLNNTFVQVLPRLDVRYDWERITLYAYAARGSKAGGYNTQIFATILQNRMMTDLMADMGVHMVSGSDPRFTDPAITAYRPETAWTGEAGLHALLYRSEYHRLNMDAAAFWNDIRDMQVTVFPNGKTTGRMMSNAAHARSAGAEAALRYQWSRNQWQTNLTVTYGFTDARFIAFNNGIGDYSGKVVPYAPRHTLSARGTVQYRLNHSHWTCPHTLAVNLQTNAQGRIYWDEANNLYQPFYAVLNANAQVRWQHLSFRLYAHNLTNTRYDLFYFVSMSRPFLQTARPIQVGAALRWDF